jgi:penicillin-binding protein 1A
VKKRNIKKRRKKRNKGFWKAFSRYILFAAVSGFVAISCILLYFAGDLPDLHNLKTEVRNPSVTIQTYDGKVIGSYGDLYEDVVKIDSLPKHVIAAFMSVEDKRFFQHFGVDFVGLARATYSNLVSRRVVQGGSTITQQLAKNILISEKIITHYDRSIGRKIRELLLSFWLEYKFTKSDIMMMYLNRVYFGAGTYGIDAASRKYFNKPSNKLSVFESAILAGLLKAPSRYSPTNHPSYAYERALIVLKAMEEQGFIKSCKEIEEEQGKEFLASDTVPQKGYMYFCDYAYEQAKKILGSIEDDIIVVTTFDENKQKAAEESIDFYLRTERENFNFSQAAIICMARDGAIQAMVGGVGYSKTQFNRATQAERLPGSAFKIFVYGAALEYGYQIDDMISDKPLEISGWAPKNYKWRSRGDISVLDGFSYSVNSVSIRLAQAVGLKRIAKFAEKLGIYNVSVHDMSVALGTTPVTLKDITAAYTSFMDGLPIWPYCILEIRTKSGKILFEKKTDRGRRVIDKDLLRSCRRILRSVVKKGSGRAANVNDYIYGKTGTNGSSDAMFIMFYDPEGDEDNGFSLGVWIGNDRNDVKMADNSTGGRIPARIAARFTKTITEGKEEVQDSETESLQKTERPTGLGNLLRLE